MSRRYDIGEQGNASGGRANRRRVTVKVCMLDDSVVKFDLEPKDKGKALYDEVYNHLNLEEREYFGLNFYDKNDNLFWVDDFKPLNKQVKDLCSTIFRFCVKFYPPDPALLQEEYTRYLFGLQIKRDLLNGRLKCSENTAALLASYIVQGDLGDYDPSTCGPGYLSEYQFFPGQTTDTEKRISTYHKEHRGLMPADADYNLLDVARRLEMYGITLYPAKDKDCVDLELAAAHMGVLVFQSGSKINTFSWAKIRKLSFKRKRFLVKLHPEIFGHYKDIVEFTMPSRNACKSFWKIAITTHAFFRQNAGKPAPKAGPRILSRGSSYRYSGRTQKEIVEGCRTSFRQQPSFERSQSMRSPTRDNSMGNSSQPSPRVYAAGYGNETRVVEGSPPRPLIPHQEEPDERPGSLNGPVASVEHVGSTKDDEKLEDEEHFPDQEDSPPNNAGAIQLQDLDKEPDMTREESDTPSGGVSEDDLEWQAEPLEVAVTTETQAIVNANPVVKHAVEQEHDDGFEHGAPLNYYGNEEENDVEQELVVPEGCVRIEYQPQPRPPSPVEVSDVDTLSPPPPSPPPPREDVKGEDMLDEVRDDGVGQEFPSPPPEVLPSPPPELQYEDERSEETKPPSPTIVHHNGFQPIEKATNQEPAKLNITCSSIVTKVQNGGAIRHGKDCDEVSSP